MAQGSSNFVTAVTTKALPIVLDVDASPAPQAEPNAANSSAAEASDRR